MPGYAAEFRYGDSFENEQQDVISSRYLFERDGRRIKYRITHSERERSASRHIAERCLIATPWGACPVDRGVSRRP